MNNAVTPQDQVTAKAHGQCKKLHARRVVLAALAALPISFSRPVHANDNTTVKIAQTTALSGPLDKLGGFDVSFSDASKNASRFVELTMVSRNGRFIRQRKNRC